MLWTEMNKAFRAYRQQVKTKWPKLTDTDLDAIKGQRPTLVSLLEKRHGLAKPQADKEIDAFLQATTPVAKAKP